MARYKHLFGPVPSRRFGRSLGIDLTPFKTCSFDCIFCQLGHTTVLTADRSQHVPLKQVFDELDDWKKNDGVADILTLAGSGEPTLHSGFGEVIEHARSLGLPVALLTNGSLLHLPEVRKAAAGADIVKVSLSAWNDESFKAINRPFPEIDFNKLITGERLFRKEFKGRLFVEVFVLQGINSSPGQIADIARIVATLSPDKIQLNTCVRPPSESFAQAESQQNLSRLISLFQPEAEVIAEFGTAKHIEIQVNEDAVLEMLNRRPCTSAQIAEVFGMHLNEVAKYVGKLLRSGKIMAVKRNEETYFTRGN